MSATVDVLEVLDRELAARELGPSGHAVGCVEHPPGAAYPCSCNGPQLTATRAAVAELIDRHEIAVRWLEDIAAQRDLSDWGELCRRGHTPWQSVIDESHAALARCKGAQA